VRVIADVQALPLLLAAFLALLAVGAVGHALASTVRRRRHDVAVLRALGLTRRQTRATVAWQATTLALVGLVFGVPLGLALGRTIWRIVAEQTPMLYVAPFAVVAVVLVPPAAVALFNALAAWPGHLAARFRPADSLRTE
jgi:ABC-type lipoprotein release transport system permease subunit